MPGNEPIRLTLADDHPVFLAGLKSLLAAVPQLRVVGEAPDAAAALALVMDKKPDIAILDLSMPGDTFAVLEKLAKALPDTRTIVYTAFCGMDSAIQALDAGAGGIVLKSAPVRELLEAIRDVGKGQLAVSQKFSNDVMLALRGRSAATRRQEELHLSLREKQVIAQLVLGCTNREIARALKISEKTVKYHMTSLMLKLNARNRLDVVIAAQQQGIEGLPLQG